MTIVMYRIKEREVENSKKMRPEHNYWAHYWHANDHDGKVLFTTDAPVGEDIDCIILALSKDKQLIGDVVAHGRYGNVKDVRTDKAAFTVPSQWENRLQKHEIEEGYTWFEVENLEELSSRIKNSLYHRKHIDDNFDDVFSNKDRKYTSSPFYLIERDTNASN